MGFKLYHLPDMLAVLRVSAGTAYPFVLNRRTRPDEMNGATLSDHWAVEYSVLQ